MNNLNISQTSYSNAFGGAKLKVANDEKDAKNTLGDLKGAITSGNADAIKEAASKIDAKALANSYAMEYMQQSFSSSKDSSTAQSALFGLASGYVPENLTEILSGINLNAIGYNGKPLTTLSKEEASELVSENGFFGIDKTTERIAGFVINGAGDDLEKLKAGREGMVRGFKEAERMWGDKLPEISQKTMQKAIESVDKRIAELGGNVLNVTV